MPFIPKPRGARLLYASALAAAGAELLVQWGRVWNLAPDLAWGWAVPLLIGYFFWARWKDRPPRGMVPHCGTMNSNERGLNTLFWVVGAGALVLLPFSRLLLEPFPGWPFAQWLHAAVLMGLILALIAAWDGVPQARHFAWPLLFGLTALPWPTFISSGAIGELRIGLSALVTEILNALGEPATSTGTVIQVGTGSIGIDEACGGIRSLQTAVMVALAIGELRRDDWRRRLKWLGLGIALALAANLLRIGTLAMICSRAGPATLAVWHDRVAALEMIFTLGGLALLAVRAGVPALPVRTAARTIGAREPARLPVAMAIFVLGIVGLTEIGTLAWFGTGARQARSAAHWTAHLPVQLSSYSGDDFTPFMQGLLQCDSHQLGHWLDSSDARRAGYILEWHSGQFAQYAVRLHNPDVCLNLAGSQLLRVMPPVTVGIGSFELPFAVREFQHGRETYYVYFLAWNISTGEPLTIAADATESSASWFGHQWAEVRARRRQLEARMVALAIFDAADAAEAEQAFRAQIARIVDPR